MATDFEKNPSTEIKTQPTISEILDANKTEEDYSSRTVSDKLFQAALQILKTKDQFYNQLFNRQGKSPSIGQAESMAKALDIQLTTSQKYLYAILRVASKLYDKELLAEVLRLTGNSQRLVPQRLKIYE